MFPIELFHIKNGLKHGRTCALTRVSWSWSRRTTRWKCKSFLAELEEPWTRPGRRCPTDCSPKTGVHGYHRDIVNTQKGDNYPFFTELGDVCNGNFDPKSGVLTVNNLNFGELRSYLHSEPPEHMHPHALENTEILAAAALEAVLASPGLRFIAGDFNFEASKKSSVNAHHSLLICCRESQHGTREWFG